MQIHQGENTEPPGGNNPLSLLFFSSIICWRKGKHQIPWPLRSPFVTALNIWYSWAAQHAQYTQFLIRPSKKKLNIYKTKEYLRAYCPNLYNYCVQKAGFGPSGHSATWKRLDRYLGHPKPNEGH